MNKRITNAEERLTKARDNLENVIEAVQAKCKHPVECVHEGAWQPETHYFRADAPFRVCTKCGLAERGWGIGYHTLPNTDTSMSRKKAQTFVKRMISEEEKCEKRQKEWKEEREASIA